MIVNLIMILIVVSAYSQILPDYSIEGDPVTDIDGNVYKTVVMGNQIWMKENLNVKTFSNGDKIPTITPDTLDLSDLENPIYQFAYKSDESIADIYGRFYTWYTVVDSRNVCPTGWHVPSDEEFCELENFVEANSDVDCNLMDHRGKNQGGYLKAAGFVHWIYPNTGADNRYGFTVLPAGIRYFNGFFDGITHYAYFWTTTEFDEDRARTRRFYYNERDVSRGEYYKRSSLSVRCVKD